ncbi:hypothetical protein [Gloeothece verrucosa]|uniref:Uncharacterized protein n=1 Tax=Gloeothece verrucosa (strain PCC 7822) TaxID=497965 RepID=E0UHQ7_GLOV7|nr:hypothetical protein [Gloeothece verrucosa]ADN13314.1 hypothetical protein Cyan7822_1313 [Gloeothece verrucosa PCC 7822]
MPNRRSRYSRIIGGERGAEAATALCTWIQEKSKTLKDHQSKNKGKNRPAVKFALVRLFQWGISPTDKENDTPDGKGGRVSYVPETYTKYAQTDIRTGTKFENLMHPYQDNGDAPSGWSTQPKGDATPAKAIITSGRSGTGTTKVSHVTKLNWTDYGGTSASLPFGVPTTATGAVQTPPSGHVNTEIDVFRNIKTKIQATGTNILVTHRQEGLMTE